MYIVNVATNAPKSSSASLPRIPMSFFFICSLPFLPRLGVVEVHQRGVERLLADDDGHVVVDYVAHVAPRDGAAVLQVVLDKDEVEAQVASLLLHHGVDAVHALAGDVVVHE